MRNGVCSPRPMLALPMSANEFSYWPTAVAQDANSSSGSRPEWGHGDPKAEDSESAGMRHARGVADTLTAQSNLWRTPDAPSGGGVRNRQGSIGAGHQTTIAEQAEHWPTPNALVSNDGETAESWNRRKDRMLALGINGNGLGMPLTIAATTWPSPRARDHHASDSDGKKTQGIVPDLAHEAQKWPTPNASEPGGELRLKDDRQTRDPDQPGNYHQQLGRAVEKCPTPMASDDGNKVTPASHQGGLTVTARFFPSPASRDYRSPNAKPYAERGGGKKGEQLPNFVEHLSSPQGPEILSGKSSSTPVVSAHGSELSPTTKPVASVLGRRRLNPAFVCWLMGWPWWWTRAEPTSFGAAGTALWRSSLERHLSFLLGGR